MTSNGQFRMTPADPVATEVRGGRVHNLKDIDVDVPLRGLVAIAGVSGSGKSSLAMGILYAEGSRRYIEALSTYTRRRMSHSARADVESVRHVPAALALRQRPTVPGIRSTFGTSTELLNILRVLFSRLGSHQCPNGHLLPPTIDVAANLDLVCPICGESFYPPGAESLAFNSDGACPTCTGTGTVREIDNDKIIPDPTKTIDEGAVTPWKMFGLTVMPQVVAELGVRTDVPFSELTNDEIGTVLTGPEEKRKITVPSKNGKLFELNFTYRNARRAVQEALTNASTDKGLARVSRFVTSQPCPTCSGTRLSAEARSTHVAGIDLAEATALTLDDTVSWMPTVIAELPPEMHSMARSIINQFTEMAQRLTQLGLGYLSLDRVSSTLSTGERQRVQLARAVRNQTTGILYVLDEPSIGLHPSNIEGLVAIMRDLLADGNSVVMVDHDVQLLNEADWLIEIGPGSGDDGGTILTTGTPAEVSHDPASQIGGFLSSSEQIIIRNRAHHDHMFERGDIHLTTDPIHTVQGLEVHIPIGRMTAVTGVSGSGKTTLILDSLAPALSAQLRDEHGPTHVTHLHAPGIARVHVVDATPIGTNIRSTIATYSGALDELRRAYADTDTALTAADFSYNTGSLRCPRCEGTGQIVLDVQFLPDVDIACPNCHGTRYSPQGHAALRATPDGDTVSLPDLLGLTVSQATHKVSDLPRVHRKLQTLVELGLGYLALNEPTPTLSGGEAQRLKLATELHRKHHDTLYVFDEPSVGLHPLDIRTLLKTLERLRNAGATILVIEHDLHMIANADYIIDLGLEDGTQRGTIIATGTPEHITSQAKSATATYLAQLLN